MSYTTPVTAQDWAEEAVAGAPFWCRGVVVASAGVGHVGVEAHVWPGCPHPDRVRRRVADHLDAVRPVNAVVSVVVVVPDA